MFSYLHLRTEDWPDDFVSKVLVPKAPGPEGGKSMGLGMHLPVTSGLRQEVQLLLLCPNTYVDSSSPFSLQSARLSWSNS